MVTFTNPGGQGHYPSYYRTRRTPFVALQDQDVVRYDSEVIPVYSDHDARIRGVQPGTQLALQQARTHSSTDNTYVESSSSSRRGIHGSHRPDAHGSAGTAQGTTYVIEEHVPAELYYNTRRTPFAGQQNTDSVGYSTEVVPAYSDHDVMIRGTQSVGQRHTDNALVERSSRRREIQSSDERFLSRRGTSCQREYQSPPRQALAKRSSSCSREVQSSGTRQANGRQTKEYVIEEHIPAEYNYRTPSKAELIAQEYDRQPHSVMPSKDSPVQLVKILEEPGVLYYAPHRSDEPKPWPLSEHQAYYDNRRAVFTEPKGSELKKYTFNIEPSDACNARQLRSSSYDNTSDRKRSSSHSREGGLKQQVIYEDVSSDMRQDNRTNGRDVNNERALVPFNRSQSVPPAQQDQSYQWIKIPRGPTTITVYPGISSKDPSTWTNQGPVQVKTQDTQRALVSRASHEEAVEAVVKEASQSKKPPPMEIVTYQHFPKEDMAQEKKEVVADHRFDRSHIDNRGSEYRPKWVNFRGGPSPFVYSSIYCLDTEACNNPALTGYVGNTKYLEEKQRSKTKDNNEYAKARESSIDKNYMAKAATSKVNRILNNRQDFEKKHLLDMLFDIKHILKEREALGEYEIPLRLKNKMNLLTSSVQDISGRNKGHRRTDPYPYSSEPAGNFLAVSSLMAPIRPDHGRTNATTRYKYMLHEPRIKYSNCI